MNRVLRTPLGPEDVKGVYAGLRPLLAGESEHTSRLSREHSVASPAPGLVVVAGGKYTTYRVMARDAVDRAAAGMDGHVARSCTHALPLIGAEGFPALVNGRRRIADASGLHVRHVEHLLGRYGAEIEPMLGLVAASQELGEPIPGAEDYLKVEALWGATH